MKKENNMGVLLILILLLVGSIILWKAGDCDVKEFLGMGGAFICILAIVIIGIFCIVENATAPKIYADMAQEREAIEYRLDRVEDDSNFTVNGGMYNDLVEYNNKLRSYKLYTHNFWIGWSYADAPAELDYIELTKDTP
jgi:hypothetical protein